MFWVTSTVECPMLSLVTSGLAPTRIDRLECRFRKSWNVHGGQPELLQCWFQVAVQQIAPVDRLSVASREHQVIGLTKAGQSPNFLKRSLDRKSTRLNSSHL